MTDKELIKRIRILRQIEPSKKWVFLAKTRILGEEFTQKQRENIFSIFNPILKPAGLGFGFSLILFIFFGFCQNSLPGDLLYSVKRATENSQQIFFSEAERSKMDLELANKRLEELSKVTQKNDVKKLAPAINEFKTNISKTAKNLAKIKKIDKRTIDNVVKIEENKEKIEKILAVEIGNNDYNEYLKAMARVVENQLNDLEKRTLNKEQKEILEKAKQDYQNEKYNSALEKILFLNYPQD